MLLFSLLLVLLLYKSLLLWSDLSSVFCESSLVLSKIFLLEEFLDSKLSIEIGKRLTIFRGWFEKKIM